MSATKILLATLLGGVLLFLLDGAFQAIPHFGITAVQSLESKDYTTPKFAELQNRMAYINTGETVTFAATQPAGFYNLGKFFAIEFLCALGVAFLFAQAFARFPAAGLKVRVAVAFLFALAVCFAVHVPYLNWWGFSMPYALGVMTKTLTGWTTLAFFINKFVYKIN
jgi:hypothetical protein